MSTQLSSGNWREWPDEAKLRFLQRLRETGDERRAPSLSLHEFAIAAWPVLEPGRTFSDNWHIRVICEHLEAATRGEIRNLVINMPPRHMKSLLVGVFWFAWEWTFNPSTRWLCASYAQPLATRDSLKCRRLITSPWYTDTFGAIALVGDQNQKTRFENDRTGYRIATSVDGTGTGEGGDRIVVDDPHNVRKAESEQQRTTAVDWWFQTMSTRANDEATAVRVVVMQRLHERDLTGEILSRELGYEHLCIPARYETDRVITTTLQRARADIRDPRRVDREPLHPARYDDARLALLENELGAYGTAGQLQQRPAPREGGMFKATGLRTRDEMDVPYVAPRGTDVKYVRHWDLGGSSQKTGDRTVGLLMAKTTDGRYHVVDIAKGRWAPEERNARIRQTGTADQQVYSYVPQRIERGIGLSVEVTAEIVRQCAGVPIEEVSARGDKTTRADPFASQCNGGNVRIIEAPWNREFIDECLMFGPGCEHDDQVDAASGAFAFLAGGDSVWVDL
jgi:predicted phage terminase large subunit-like protein